MVPFKSPIGLALAGLAAFAYYKYSKMTEDQKRDLANNIKEKGKKIFGSLVPESNSQGNPAFQQGSDYTG
jgi:hypothetical protein